MAEGWFKTERVGKCSQCDDPANHYHRIEYSYEVHGIPIAGAHIVYRCERHTVRPYESAHVCGHKSDCPNMRVEEPDE